MVINAETIAADLKEILHTRFEDLRVVMACISKITRVNQIVLNILISLLINVTIREPLLIQLARD